MSWTEADIPDQTGRVAVVTGANSGLGLETARELARKGAVVVMAARNMGKGAAAKADILSEIPDAKLELMTLDLADTKSIKAFANDLMEAHPRVDLLFNNAGVMATAERETADGFELQFGTNHLGHFYLTFLLMPALLRADAGRVVTTTSTARFSAGKYDMENPHLRGEYDPWVAYGHSKRANLHFSMELNNRLEAAGARVTAHAADPGFSVTELQATSVKMSDGSDRQTFFEKWVPRVGQSAAAGALPQLRAGTDPDVKGGTLWRPRWIIRGAPVEGKIGKSLSKPSDLIAVWAVSEKDLGIDFDVAGMVEAA